MATYTDLLRSFGGLNLAPAIMNTSMTSKNAVDAIIVTPVANAFYCVASAPAAVWVTK